MQDMSVDADRVQFVVHDDEETPRSFVIDLIHTVFEQPPSDAIAIARMIERQGKVTFGPFSRAAGETMWKAAQDRIKVAGHSLKITAEPRDGDSEIGPDCCRLCGESADVLQVHLNGKTTLICGECVDEIAERAPRRDRGEQFKYAFEVLKQQFVSSEPDELVSTSRQFPAHVRADLQTAVDKLFSNERAMFFGVRQQYSSDTLSFAKLCDADDNAYPLAAAQYHEIDVGDAVPVKCLRNGLWVGDADHLPYAVVLCMHRENDDEIMLNVEITVPEGAQGAEFVQRCFAEMESAIAAARAYRGKVLSFEGGSDYRGRARGLMVHKLPKVSRDEVILPATAVKLLDRNVLRFVESRQQLRALGQSTRKGILLYGPPGTGKTHTIRYLASNLPGHTTLIITAAQVVLLGAYMNLARLLQPALVVIEDVDLIARDRAEMGACEEPLLNQLLNEMDGLKEDADIIFVLTTNRPEQLETALAGRPGRIDQAIELPLPDEIGRGKLARLYGKGLKLDAGIVDEVARRTAGVSAAFIKELMRRTAQGSVVRGGGASVELTDVTEALDDMLFAGGKLNVKLLGGAQPTPADASGCGLYGG
jgi:ATP-dependent Clp protease adapter protein ClpS